MKLYELGFWLELSEPRGYYAYELSVIHSSRRYATLLTILLKQLMNTRLKYSKIELSVQENHSLFTLSNLLISFGVAFWCILSKIVFY